MRKNAFVILVALVGIAVALSGFFAFRTIGDRGSEPIDRSFDFGFTYVNLTPKQAAASGISSGALVTGVVPGSPADLAGIAVNDVICSFNGAALDEESPLYGMIRCCAADTPVEVQLLHEDSLVTVTMVNSPGVVRN